MTEVTVAWGRVTLTEPRFALGCLHVLHAKMEEAQVVAPHGNAVMLHLPTSRATTGECVRTGTDP